MSDARLLGLPGMNSSVYPGDWDLVSPLAGTIALRLPSLANPDPA